MKIHWIASYPKSGNTWVRFLLYHYLWGKLDDTRKLSVRIPDLHKRELDSADPRGGIAGSETPLLVKTHFLLDPRMPYHERTAGTIYVVRHPKDVLLSALNYVRMAGYISALTSDEDYARQFIAAGGDPSWIQYGFGTWDQHALSWNGQRRFPVLLVRYRDLKADAARELRRIVEFLGLPVDEPRLREAAESSTFERMRSLEMAEKASGRGSPVFDGSRTDMQKGRLFMNKGEMGRSLAMINPRLDAEFDRRFMYALWMMGYGANAGAPVGTMQIPA